MLALITLINIGDRELVEFPSAVGRAKLPDGLSTNLLVAGYGWMMAVHSTMPAKVAVADTQWAVDSGNPELSQAGWEFRAVFQDPDAVERRGKRLVACISQKGARKNSYKDCLRQNEWFSASQATITALWNKVSPEDRKWLVAWAASTDATQRFFLDQLPEQPPIVQAAILSFAFGPLSADPSLAIKGALVVLQQALDVPDLRPKAITIDFNNDYQKSGYGGKAYGDDYPRGLQAAFDALATYPDAAALMNSFAMLDHPWLATQAGIWLLRNGQIEAGRSALRFALADPQLSSTQTPKSLAPINDGESPEKLRAQFVETVRDGALGKWGALANDSYKPLLSDPEIVVLVRERIAQIPARVKRIHGAFVPGQPIQEQMQGIPGLKDEMRGFEWVLTEVVQSNPAVVDGYVDIFAIESEQPWQALAMTLAMEYGRAERAQTLAKGLTDSQWPEIADQANKVLALKGIKPD